MRSRHDRLLDSPVVFSLRSMLLTSVGGAYEAILARGERLGIGHERKGYRASFRVLRQAWLVQTFVVSLSVRQTLHSSVLMSFELKNFKSGAPAGNSGNPKVAKPAGERNTTSVTKCGYLCWE